MKFFMILFLINYSRFPILGTARLREILKQSGLYVASCNLDNLINYKTKKIS